MRTSEDHFFFILAVLNDGELCWRLMQPEAESMNDALTEQITPEVIQALITQAATSGLTVNDYLARLLGVTNGAQPAPQRATVDEFITAMESMAEDVPPLPRDFSREDIYLPKN